MAYSEAISDVISIMETQLATITSISTDHINFINTSYVPSGETFLQVMIFAAEPSQASLGTIGQFRFDGVFEIDVYTQMNTGRGGVNPILKEIKELFLPGTTLTNGEISVQCKTVWESTQDFQDNWYIVPINVRWYAYTSR